MGRAANGTLAAPTAITANTPLALFNGRGYDGTSYSTYANGGMLVYASENFTPAAKGTFLTFTTTANGATSSGERMRIDNAGNVGIGTPTPGAKLEVAGTVKLGAAGTVITNMGVCTVASYTPTSTTTNVTCTGVPASTGIAVNCSASAAFQTPNSTTIYARATGIVDQIAVNLSAANNVAVTLKCMWMQ